jgi:hypothetical protein
MAKKPPVDPTQIEPSLADPEKHQCFLLYLVGFGAAEIEQRTGVRADRIRKWSERDGWPTQREHYENLLREKNPTVQQPIVQSVVRAAKGERKKEYLEKSGQIAIDDVAFWTGLPPEMRLAAADKIAAANKMHRDNLGLNEEAEAGTHSHISLHFLTQADNEGMVRLLPEKVKEIEDAK